MWKCSKSLGVAFLLLLGMTIAGETTIFSAGNTPLDAAGQTNSSNEPAVAVSFDISRLPSTTQQEALEHLPLCAAGNAEACHKLGWMFAHVDDHDQAIRAALVACSLWTGQTTAENPNAEASEQGCLDAAQFYDFKTNDVGNDFSTIMQYLQIALDYSTFGCSKFKELVTIACRERDRYKEAMESEIETQQYVDRLNQKAARSRAQMGNILMQGLFGIAGATVQGLAKVEAAKKGIVPYNVPVQIGAATLGVNGACGTCQAKCSALINNCRGGGQAGCYNAAACLCQCNLDAGGCGSTPTALQQCIQGNASKSNALK